MNRVIKYLFVLISLFSFHVKAEESVDLSMVLRCDAVFCPDGQQQGTIVESQAGFEIPKDTTGVIIQRQVISVSINGRTLAPSIKPQLLNSENSQSKSDAPISYSEPNGTYKTASLPQNYQSNTGIQHSLKPSNQPIYRDIRGPNGEEPSTVYVPVEPNNQINGSSSFSGSYQPSNVFLNGNTDNERKSSDSEKIISTYPNMNKYEGFEDPQQFQNSPLKESEGSKSSILAALASKLGNSFFNIAPPTPKNSIRKKNMYNSHNLKKRKNKNGKNRVWDKDFLKRSYNKYRRGIASQLELGASNLSLFKNVCNHYADYAENHRIPQNSIQCANLD